MEGTEGRKDFRIVCIGSSAGGLQPCVEILRGLPADTGMAFVMISHRAVEKPQMLPVILGRATTMPVFTVAQEMPLEPNQVYVMPPRVDLTVHQDRFAMKQLAKPLGWPKTITGFLYSLADSVGPRAVAVILSGLDGDGSAALKAVKERGGVTFAQAGAACESMPDTAVETGNVDYFLPSAEIADALVALSRQPLQRR